MKIGTFVEFNRNILGVTEEKIRNKIEYLSATMNIFPGIEILICRSRDINIQILDKFPDLKFIYMVSVGIDGIPFKLLAERSIRVAHTPGNVCAREIAEYSLASILYYNKSFQICLYNQQNHLWDRSLRNSSLSYETVTIIGTGVLGQEIAKLSQTFGLTVYGISRTGKEKKYFKKIVTWNTGKELIRNSDYVISTLPLTSETEKIYDHSFFSNLNRNAVFINVGRGKCVDQSELFYFLNKRLIRGAVLDVFETEPLPYESNLWDLNNLLITPHISGRIHDFVDRSLELFPEIYSCYMNNLPIKSEINFDIEY